MLARERRQAHRFSDQLLRPSGTYQNAQVEIEDFDLRTH
jgi:hypothetical protein